MIDKKIILIVDSDKRRRESISYALDSQDCKLILAQNSDEAFNCIDQEKVNVLISPLKSDGIDGMQLLEVVKLRHPDSSVIFTVSQNTIDTDIAIKAMRGGADDFLSKPLNLDKLKAMVEKALERQAIILENIQLRQQLDEKFGLVGFTGSSPKMYRIYERLSQIAQVRNTTVLIVGDSGTGKELAAKAIHFNSSRKEKPFIKVHCAALSETLIESELFGHVKGAYTGAFESRKGRFELADGGTLFLDEIGELSLTTQVKLLRVLNEQEFERVGGSHSIKVDMRIIAATSRNLEEAVQKGLYREDLYYRLNVVKIEMPSLRERREDVPALINVFMQQFCKDNDKEPKELTNRAMKALIKYDWPGNVRELKNCIESMVVMSQRKILDVDDIPQHILQSFPDFKNSLSDDVFPSYIPFVSSASVPSSLSFSPSSNSVDGNLDSPDSQNFIKFRVGITFEEVEREMIKETLKYTNNNKAKAAKILGIGLRTLFRKVKAYQL